MENTPKYQISIPKPCHEDWNKMTPDEKGAFCGACQKTVVDFSDKSNEEIVSIIEESNGTKLCGRFKTEQLSRPKAEPAAEAGQAGRAALRYFAYVLFLVFGSTLFSCDTDDDRVVGEMVAIEQPIGKKGDDQEDLVLGQMIAIPPTDSTMTGTMIDIPEDVPRLMGEVDLHPADTIAPPVNINDSLPQVPEEIYTVGMMVYIPPDLDVIPVNDTVAPPPEDVVIPPKKDPEIIAKQLKLEVFPNPGKEATNIRYTVLEKGEVTLEVYDLSGRVIKTLVKAQSHHPGIYVSRFDLSGLDSGTYLCVLTSAAEQTSTKIQVVH